MSMSKITRQQKIHLLDDLIAAHDAVHAQMDALKLTINPDPGCLLYNAVFELLEVAISSTATAIGDEGTWLDWFVHENDCGRKGHEAGYDNRVKPIRTAEDLLDLIEAEDE